MKILILEFWELADLLSTSKTECLKKVLCMVSEGPLPEVGLMLTNSNLSGNQGWGVGGRAQIFVLFNLRVKEQVD